jgi:hypothetical protein
MSDQGYGGPSADQIGGAVGRAVADAISRALGELKSSMDSVRDAVGRAQEAVKTSVDGVSGKVDNVAGKVDGIAGRVDGVASKVDGVKETVENSAGQVTHSVEKLQVGLFDRLKEELDAIRDVKTEVNRSTMAAVQAALSKFLGDLEGLKTAVRLSLVQVAEMFGKSVYRQKAICGKYDALEQGVLEAYETDIRRLGAPLYEFIEKEYAPMTGRWENFIEDTDEFFQEQSQSHVERRRQLDQRPRDRVRSAKESFLERTASHAERIATDSPPPPHGNALYELECFLVESGERQQVLSSLAADAGTGFLWAEGILETPLEMSWRRADEGEIGQLLQAIQSLQQRGVLPESAAEFLTHSISAHGIEIPRSEANYQP